MGHVNKGRVQAPPEQDDLRTHLVAQLGVQVGQRLVHQEHLRLAYDGTADRHALALAAGQRFGLAVQVFLDAQDVRGLDDPAVHLLLFDLPDAQAERQVFIHGDVRVKRIILEHHGDVAVLGFHVVHHAVTDLQDALGDVLQARDHAQGGGFPAAGGADEHDELLVLDFQVEILDSDHLVVIDFFDMFECYACHLRPSSTFHGAAGHAFHIVSLQHQEQDGDGDRHQNAARAEPGEIPHHVPCVHPLV
ncbi:MAG: hypothetical protein A4E72_00739 [Syntrophus sp. PtaU1.Bin208]|nr:MAG: hypothetical protein A4E72_00739 [Syntrophus sp. PtaU1.Bin208]